MLPQVRCEVDSAFDYFKYSEVENKLINLGNSIIRSFGVKQTKKGIEDLAYLISPKDAAIISEILETIKDDMSFGISVAKKYFANIKFDIESVIDKLSDESIISWMTITASVDEIFRHADRSFELFKGDLSYSSFGLFVEDMVGKFIMTPKDTIDEWNKHMLYGEFSIIAGHDVDLLDSEIILEDATSFEDIIDLARKNVLLDSIAEDVKCGTILTIRDAVYILKSVSKKWNEISNMIHIRKEHPVSIKIPTMLNIIDMMDIYLGDYDKLPKSYPTDYGVPNAMNCGLVLDPAMYNTLASDTKKRVDTFLAASKVKFNQTISLAKNIISDNLLKVKKSNKTRLSELIPCSPTEVGYDDTSMINDISKMISTVLKILSSESSDHKLVEEFTTSVIPISNYTYSMLVAKHDVARVRDVISKLCGDSIYSVIGYLLTPITNELTHPSDMKIDDTPIITSPIDEDSFDDAVEPISGGDRSATSLENYITEITEAQKKFDKNYTTEYRNIINVLRSITIKDDSPFNEVQTMCTYIGEFAIENPRTTQFISGLYPHVNSNEAYVSALNNAKTMIASSSLTEFKGMISALDRLIKLMNDVKQEGIKIRTKYMHSKKGVSEAWYIDPEKLKFEYITNPLSPADFQAFRAQLRRIINYAGTKVSSMEKSSTNDFIKEYTSRLSDRAKVITEYYDNKIDEVKRFGEYRKMMRNDNRNPSREMLESYKIEDTKVNIEMQLLRSRKTIMLWINSFDEKMARLALQEYPPITVEDTDKMEKSHMLFTSSTRISQETFYQNMVKLSNMLTSKTPDLTGIIKVLIDTFKAINFTGYLEQIDSSLNMYGKVVNWTELNSKITELMVLNSIEAGNVYQKASDVRLFGTKTQLLSRLCAIIDGSNITLPDDRKNDYKNVGQHLAVLLFPHTNEHDEPGNSRHGSLEVIIHDKVVEELCLIVGWGKSDVPPASKIIGMNNQEKFNRIYNMAIEGKDDEPDDIPGFSDTGFSELLTPNPADQSKNFRKINALNYDIKSSTDTLEFRLAKSIVDGLYSRVFSRIHDYFKIKYQGNISELRGGDAAPEVEGGSVFDVMRLEHKVNGDVIVDAVPFYICGLKMIKHYYDNFFRETMDKYKRYTDTGVIPETTQGEILGRYNDYSLLAPVFDIVKEISGDDFSSLTYNQLEKCIERLNYIWTTVTDKASNNIRLSMAIDRLLSELSSMIIIATNTDKDIMGNPKENRLETSMETSAIDKTKEILAKFLKDLTSTPMTTENSTAFETYMRDAMSDVADTPESSRITTLKKHLTSERNFTHSGLQSYYGFMELVMTPITILQQAYESLFIIFQDGVKTSSATGDINLNIINIKYRDYSHDAATTNREAKVWELIQRIIGPGQEVALKSVFMNNPVVIEYNRILLDDAIIDANNSGTFKMPNLWRVMDESTYPRNPILKTKYPQGSSIVTPGMVLMLKTLYPDVRSDNLSDYCDRCLREYKEDFKAIIQNFAAFPGLNDKVRFNLVEASETSIKELETLGNNMRENYKNVKITKPTSIEPPRIGSPIVVQPMYDGGSVIGGYEINQNPTNGIKVNDNLYLHAANVDVGMNMLYSWIDWLIIRIAECDCVDNCLPTSFTTTIQSITMANRLIMKAAPGGKVAGSLSYLKKDDSTYYNIMTQNILTRSSSSINVAKGNNLDQNHVALLTSRLPYLIHMMKSASTIIEDIPTRRLIDDMIQATTRLFNDISPSMPYLPFMSTHIDIGCDVPYEIKTFKDLSCFVGRYDAESMSSNDFLSMEWANQNFFENRDLVWPKHPGKNKFAALESILKPVINSPVFRSAYSGILNKMGKFAWRTLIAKSIDSYSKPGISDQTSCNELVYTIINNMFECDDEVIEGVINEALQQLRGIGNMTGASTSNRPEMLSGGSVANYNGMVKTSGDTSGIPDAQIVMDGTLRPNLFNVIVDDTKRPPFSEIAENPESKRAAASLLSRMGGSIDIYKYASIDPMAYMALRDSQDSAWSTEIDAIKSHLQPSKDIYRTIEYYRTILAILIKTGETGEMMPNCVTEILKDVLLMTRSINLYDGDTFVANIKKLSKSLGNNDIINQIRERYTDEKRIYVTDLRDLLTEITAKLDTGGDPKLLLRYSTIMLDDKQNFTSDSLGELMGFNERGDRFSNDTMLLVEVYWEIMSLIIRQTIVAPTDALKCLKSILSIPVLNGNIKVSIGGWLHSSEFMNALIHCYSELRSKQILQTANVVVNVKGINGIPGSDATNPIADNLKLIKGAMKAGYYNKYEHTASWNLTRDSKIGITDSSAPSNRSIYVMMKPFYTFKAGGGTDNCKKITFNILMSTLVLHDLFMKRDLVNVYGLKATIDLNKDIKNYKSWCISFMVYTSNYKITGSLVHDITTHVLDYASGTGYYDIKKFPVPRYSYIPANTKMLDVSKGDLYGGVITKVEIGSNITSTDAIWNTMYLNYPKGISFKDTEHFALADSNNVKILYNTILSKEFNEELLKINHPYMRMNIAEALIRALNTSPRTLSTHDNSTDFLNVPGLALTLKLITYSWYFLNNSVPSYDGTQLDSADEAKYYNYLIAHIIDNTLTSSILNKGVYVVPTNTNFMLTNHTVGQDIQDMNNLNSIVIENPVYTVYHIARNDEIGPIKTNHVYTLSQLLPGFKPTMTHDEFLECVVKNGWMDHIRILYDILKYVKFEIGTLTDFYIVGNGNPFDLNDGKIFNELYSGIFNFQYENENSRLSFTFTKGDSKKTPMSITDVTSVPVVVGGLAGGNSGIVEPKTLIDKYRDIAHSYADSIPHRTKYVATIRGKEITFYTGKNNELEPHDDISLFIPLMTAGVDRNNIISTISRLKLFVVDVINPRGGDVQRPDIEIKGPVEVSAAKETPSANMRSFNSATISFSKLTNVRPSRNIHRINIDLDMFKYCLLSTAITQYLFSPGKDLYNVTVNTNSVIVSPVYLIPPPPVPAGEVAAAPADNSIDMNEIFELLAYCGDDKYISSGELPLVTPTRTRVSPSILNIGDFINKVSSHSFNENISKNISDYSGLGFDLGIRPDFKPSERFLDLTGAAREMFDSELQNKVIKAMIKHYSDDSIITSTYRNLFRITKSNIGGSTPTKEFIGQIMSYFGKKPMEMISTFTNTMFSGILYSSANLSSKFELFHSVAEKVIEDLRKGDKKAKTIEIICNYIKLLTTPSTTTDGPKDNIPAFLPDGNMPVISYDFAATRKEYYKSLTDKEANKVGDFINENKQNVKNPLIQPSVNNLMFVELSKYLLYSPKYRETYHKGTMPLLTLAGSPAYSFMRYSDSMMTLLSMIVLLMQKTTYYDIAAESDVPYVPLSDMESLLGEMK